MLAMAMLSPVIPGSMRAAVVKAPNSPVEIIEVSVPKIGPRDLLLKVVAASLCHSDLGILNNATWIPPEGRILGHEAAGIVVEISEDARGQGFEIGDRVGGSMWQHMCFACERCERLGPQHCENLDVKGFTSDGVFCEYITMDLRSAVKIPGIGTKDLKTICPLFCAGITVWDAIKRGRGKSGDWVVVVGAGGLGHLLIQFVCLMGYKVLAIDVHNWQLELAQQVGATVAINAVMSGPNLATMVREATDGKGAHVVFVTSASIKAYEQTLGYLRYGGTLVCVGSSPNATFPLEPYIMFNNYYTITSAKVPNAKDAQECIDFCMEHNIRAHVTSFKLYDINDMIDKMKKESFTGRMVIEFD